MSKKYPVKPAVRSLSVEAQNANIVKDAVASLAALNEGQRGTRIVTAGMAKKVAKRSLEKTKDQTYSLRRQIALVEVSRFAKLIRTDEAPTSSFSNSDLLPIAHPHSTREHLMDNKEVAQLRARWYADDPRVTNPLVASLLASAFTAYPDSPEYTYAVARLSAMGPTEVPLEALVAAYKPGANNFFWMQQLRGKDGRFIKMGGAIKRFVRRLGKVFNLGGRMVSANPDTKKVTMELPDGKLVRIPAAEGEAVKALLPTADGYSKSPVKTAASDPVIDEEDLEFVDSPDGWKKDESWEPAEGDKDYYGYKVDLGTMYASENDNYEVLKFEKANFPAKNRFEVAQQKEAEGNDVIAYGKGNDGNLNPDLPVYFVRRKDGKDKDFAAVQSWGEVQQLVAEDEKLYEKGEPSDPKRPITVSGLKSSDLKVGDIADIKKIPGDVIPGNPDASEAQVKAYEKKLAKFQEEGGEFPIDPRREYFIMEDGTIIDTETGEVLRDSLGNTEPSDSDEDAPVAELPQEDVTPETEETPETAPEAEEGSVEVPEGYYDVTRGDYFPEGAVDGQESEDFTDDPAQLAQEYSAKDLTTALAQAVRGNKENPATGFGQLPFSDGLEVVPAEALYKALEEQGEDADQILDDIYKGGNGDKAPDVAPEAKASLGEEIPDAAQGAPSDQEIPPLIDGLTEDEKTAFLETGDYKPYLPENKVYGASDVPEGYVGIDDQPWNQIESDLPADAPEGFSVNPVDIANNYNNADLIMELRRALEPGNPTPGYGILGIDTPEGEEYVANVPAEAIRDALQLQGVDTDELIDAIYEEGFKGQNADEPTDQEIQDALEGENVEEGQEPTAESEEEEIAPAEEPTPSDEAGPPAAPPTPGVATGEPDGPAKLTTKAKDLKPGDVTVSDYFTVEKVFSDAESEAIKPGSVWVEGYYPGHATQKTKLWNSDVEIDVFRNVTAPAKGDLPELSKPKPKEYDPEGKIYKDKELGVFVPKNAEARSKYLDALDQYNKDLATAKGLWSDVPEAGSLPSWQSEEVAPPHSPANPVGYLTVQAVDVKPGDVTFKKEWGNDFYEFFIVESVEEKDGKAIVKGYYPGHISQEKEWNATTPIEVMRGASDLPAPGTGPALARPKKGEADYQEKRAAFNAAKKASAEGFTPPLDPAQAPAPEKEPQGEQEAVVPKLKSPAYPAFTGERLKQIAAEANGDPIKFMELLQNEEIMVLDFETAADGAFDKQTPIQFAYTKFKNGQAIATGTFWMNPNVPLGKFYTEPKNPDEVLRDPSGNIISNEFLETQPSVDEQMAKIFERIGPDTIILAHNVPFDGQILKRYAEQLGVDYAPAGEIDTLALARLVINGDSHTLQNVAKYYGITPEGSWHDATTDSEVLYPILEKLMADMAKTKQGIQALDVEANAQKYEEDLAAYKASKNKKAIADTSLAVSKPIKDAFDGKEDLPTVDQLIESVPKDLPSSEEVTSATTPSPAEVSDGTEEIVSIFGDTVSNNWVDDNENTTDLGNIPVESWQPGDFYAAKQGGWFEILEIIPDPENDKKVFVKRRLIANGKIYGEEKSWVKYGKYQIRRRNNVVEEQAIAPEAPTPAAEAPEAEGTWNGYDIKKDADGVFYADGISASDVQKLRNGQLTPPQLPFFAPMGGGNKPDQGDGYFFSANGKRFWGKFGAAGALVRRKNNKGEYEYFLAKRSSSLSQGGGKWGYPGGAHKDKMDAEENMGIITAINEFAEEVGGDLGADSAVVNGKFFNPVAPDWAYTTHFFDVGPDELKGLTPKDGENSEIGWFTAEQINKMAEDGQLQEDFANTAFTILEHLKDTPDAEEAVVPESGDVAPNALGVVFDTSKWKKVSGQAGSNQGAFYVDPATGQQYYVKKPKSEMHAANEVLASALYEQAGLDIGRSYLGTDKKGNLQIVSPVVDGTQGNLSQFAANQEILDQIKKGFAVDAWMNNYDVIGLEKDNIVVANGKPFRVDAGGALLFRAQGASKAEQMDTNVSEQITSLRDSNQNPQAASVFGDMTDAEIAESVKLVAAIDEAKIDELVDAAFAGDVPGINSQSIADKLKENLKRRRKELIDLYNVEETAEPEAPSVPETEDESGQSVKLAINPFAAGSEEAQIDNITAQIQKAIKEGKDIVFAYNGKTVKISPEEVKTAGTGNVNVVGTLPNGQYRSFTLLKMEQSDAPTPTAEAPEAPPAPEAPEANEADEEIVEEPTEQIDLLEGEPQPVETEKPTSMPEKAKAELLDNMSKIAEAVFGKAATKEQLKTLLNNFKSQEGANSDLIDSIVEDLDAPEPQELATPEEKVAADIAASSAPQDPESEPEAPLTVDEVLKTISNPDETNPELIWQGIKDDYDGEVLANGHIVVSSVMHGEDRFDVVVRRNKGNSFNVYHRITKPDGTTKVYLLSKNNHSKLALTNSITAQISNSKFKPYYISTKAKLETDKTLLPTSSGAIPTESESAVAADGSILSKGDIAKVVNPSHSKFGQTAKVISKKRVFKSNGYGYTDYLKVKYEDGEKNQIVAKSLVPENSDWTWGQPMPPTADGDGDGGGGGTPPSTPPQQPNAPAPAAPTPTAAPAASSGESGLTSESTLADVEKVAVDKNSAMHTSYFGASDYSEYKGLVKKYLVKDASSGGKNMLPGIVASNQSPDNSDPELASYGVITKTFPGDLEVEIAYFDGPLKGSTQKLQGAQLWSQEKFLTNEQSKDLGIEVDDSIRAEAIKAQGKKAEEAKKQAALKAEQEKKQKEEAAKKAAIEKAKQELADKFTVDGPGFSVQTPDGPADWNSTPLEEVPSLQAALNKAKSNDPLEAANGAQVMLDSGDIEDLKVRIQKVEKNGEQKIRLSFKLTNWAGNAFTKKVAKLENLDVQDNARLDQYETNPDGSLKFVKEWGTSQVDGNDKGRAYRGSIANGQGEFQFIRANRSASTPDFFKKGGSSNGPVSLHNRVELLLPADATPEDIAAALEELGAIQTVRPATKADFVGVAENKIISLFGKKGNGAKNYEGELRQQILDEVKKNYDFTAEDMEIRVDEQQKGIIQYLLPQKVAEQLASIYGVEYFRHNFSNSNLPSDDKERADYVYDLLFKKGGGLYSTVNRWSEGINTWGQSSSSDLAGVGAGYVFTRKTPNMDLNQGSYKGLDFYFNGVQLIRRPEFYGSTSDEWGKKYEDMDYLALLKGANVTEVLFKDNLSWADLSGISLDSPARKILLERLTKEGITEIAGKPVEEMFGVK